MECSGAGGHGEEDDVLDELRGDRGKSHSSYDTGCTEQYLAQRYWKNIEKVFQFFSQFFFHLFLQEIPRILKRFP